MAIKLHNIKRGFIASGGRREPGNEVASQMHTFGGEPEMHGEVVYVSSNRKTCVRKFASV